MKTHKGSILVFALIVLSFILIAAFAVASVTLIEKRSSNVSVNSTTAFQQADKGMEEFLQQIYKDLKQSDTLEDVGEQLNDLYGSTAYACIRSNDEDLPANMGNTETEFIISAYKEKPVTAGDSGWDIDQNDDRNELIPITDCDTTTLAEVARFKVAGNHNTAVRAVFVKLRDSLTRGLVTHWAFEDRANNARLATDDDDKNAYVAMDTSKNKHILTLCDIRSDKEIDVLVDVENDTSLTLEKFAGDLCDYQNASGMIPLKRGDCDNDCDPSGVWEDGIVEEIPTGGVGNDASEAIYFDGTGVLASNIISATSCDHTTDLNCTKDTEDKMVNMTDGIAISLWVKADSADGVLISRLDDGDDGFEVRLEGDKVCLQIQGTDGCTNDTITDDDKWHHVVARWDKDAGPLEMIVDGEKKNLGASITGELQISASQPVTLGASDNDDNGTIEKPFTGSIDDVRIWNRALADSEVCRLCEVETTEDHDCGTTLCKNP